MYNVAKTRGLAFPCFPFSGAENEKETDRRIRPSTTPTSLVICKCASGDKLRPFQAIENRVIFSVIPFSGTFSTLRHFPFCVFRKVSRVFFQTPCNFPLPIRTTGDHGVRRTHRPDTASTPTALHRVWIQTGLFAILLAGGYRDFEHLVSVWLPHGELGHRMCSRRVKTVTSLNCRFCRFFPGRKCKADRWGGGNPKKSIVSWC